MPARLEQPMMTSASCIDLVRRWMGSIVDRRKRATSRPSSPTAAPATPAATCTVVFTSGSPTRAPVTSRLYLRVPGPHHTVGVSCAGRTWEGFGSSLRRSGAKKTPPEEAKKNALRARNAVHLAVCPRTVGPAHECV